MTKEPGRSIIRHANWLFGLFALAALLLVVGHFGQFEHFIDLARQAQPAWLILALLLQVSTYVSVALGWQRVLIRAGAPLPLRRLFPVALSKLFADQALPSAGLGGHVLLIDRLTALGTPRSAAVAALLLSMIGYYAAYAFLALATLFTLWLYSEASPLLVGLVTAFLIIALAIPSLALWLRHRGSQPLPESIEGVHPLRRILEIVGEAPSDLLKDRRLLAQLTFFNALVFLADAATLAVCLMALGQGFHPAASFIALIMASIASTLSFIPMGLGSFEATSVAMLTLLGGRVEPALAATLLLRGLTLWLPLLPGLVLMRRGAHGKGA